MTIGDFSGFSALGVNVRIWWLLSGSLRIDTEGSKEIQHGVGQECTLSAFTRPDHLG